MAVQVQIENAKALERLIHVARTKTSQGKIVSDFLLSWWNADACGGFNLRDIWATDAEVCKDMLATFELVSRLRSYPDELGYKAEFGEIERLWRPGLNA